MGKNGRSGRKLDADELMSTGKWTKARMFGQEFDHKTFSDALDVVYWIRQVLAIVVGFVWGVLPMTGAFGFIGYGAISVFSLYFYTHKLIILDEDDFAPIAVLKEGAMPAFGMFVLTWVLVYTHLHGIPASME